MEIISELEKDGRGLYTGSAGIFLPNGDFSLNVCIRTIVVGNGQAEMGIGSGVVADSAKTLEWEECLLKSSFINYRKSHKEIFETMLWQEGEIVYLDDHLERLKKSCKYFSMVLDEKKVRELLADQEFDSEKVYRVRLSVSVLGDLNVKAVETTQGWGKESLRILLSAYNLNSNNKYLYHKTDVRQIYNDEFKNCQNKGFDEVIFCNEKGFLAEGAISNIFVKVDGSWKTPALSCGLLPGTWRKNKMQETWRRGSGNLYGGVKNR